MCKNADDDGLTEVCDRQHIYHKIHIEILSFFLRFTEDYKMKKFLSVGPNVAWKTDIHGFTYNYCQVGACDG